MGRPRVDPTQKNVTVHVQLTPATYDRLWGTARRAGLTLPELLRRALERGRHSAASPLPAGASSVQNRGHAPRGRPADDQSR